MHRPAVLLLLTTSLGTMACQSAPPLANTYPSAEALGTAVLEALANGDRPRLEALALSEKEFEAYVWPDLPAARPERNLPLSYVWGDLHQKSQIRLASTVKARQGQRFVLERVTFDRATDYPTFRVHNGTTFHVRDASGAQTAIRICGSLFERKGEWKVFSYVVE